MCANNSGHLNFLTEYRVCNISNIIHYYCEVWAPIEASYGFGWQQGLSLLVSAVSQASPLSESRQSKLNIKIHVVCKYLHMCDLITNYKDKRTVTKIRLKMDLINITIPYFDIILLS